MTVDDRHIEELLRSSAAREPGRIPPTPTDLREAVLAIPTTVSRPARRTWSRGATLLAAAGLATVVAGSLLATVGAPTVPKPAPTQPLPTQPIVAPPGLVGGAGGLDGHGRSGYRATRTHGDAVARWPRPRGRRRNVWPEDGRRLGPGDGFVV